MDIFFPLSSVLTQACASKPFIAFNGPGVLPPGLVPAASTFQVFNGGNTDDLLCEQSSCFGSFTTFTSSQPFTCSGEKGISVLLHLHHLSQSLYHDF